jgi:glycosyltransferase involved in cell wall biosynthesis
VLTEHYKPEDFLINELVDEWSKKGHRPTVVTLAPTYPFGKVFNGYKNEFFSRVMDGNIEVIRFRAIVGYRESKIKKITSFFNYVILSALYVLCMGWYYDKVFIYHVGALTIGIPGIISKAYNKKITIWSQDIWPETVFPKGVDGVVKKNIYKILRLYVKLTYSLIDNIIVSCEPFVRVIGKNVPGKKIYYCPNWPIENICYEKEEKKIFIDKINITFAGNINKRRSLDIIMSAFHDFNKKDKYAQLNIVGDGSGLEYLKKIKEEKGYEDVSFWGRVPAKNIGMYYNSSDILLISLASDACYSLYLPAKFSTYLSTGKPILAVMNGAVPELMNEYYLGVAVSPNDYEGIKLAFNKIFLLNQEEKKKIFQESERILKECFDKNKIIGEITSIVIS